MSIKIVFPEGDAPRSVQGTRVYTADGHEIGGIQRISIDLAPDDVLTATITVFIDKVENLDAIVGHLEIADETRDYLRDRPKRHIRAD